MSSIVSQSPSNISEIVRDRGMVGPPYLLSLPVYGELNGHVIDVPKVQTRDPNMLRAQYLENSWSCSNNR